MPNVAVIGGFGMGLTMRAPHPPAAGETVSDCQLSVGPGGKGSNQAVAAARLGATTALLSGVGDDDYGRQGRDLWAREGVDASAVRMVGLPTMVGFIIVDPSSENRILLAPGALERLTPLDLDAFLPTLGVADVCLVSLEVPLVVARRGLHLAHAAGVLTVLDPAPVAGLTADDLVDVDVLVPNEGEAAQLAGCAAGTPVDQMIDRIRTFYHRSLIVKLGRRGVLVDDGDSRLHLPAPTVTAVDSTGAGDAFAGALATALAEGQALVDAARFAVAAAAYSVQFAEVIPSLPYRSDLRTSAVVAVQSEYSRGVLDVC